MTRTLPWVAVAAGDGVHVVPLNDLVEHEPDDCICGPRVEAVPDGTGSYGWLYTHHSLDGREAAE